MNAHIPNVNGMNAKLGKGVMSRDPFGSMQGFMGQFQGFMQNPMQYMMQNKLNLPANINPMQDPQGAIQYLMNSGKMSQEMYNGLQQMSQQIQQNPQFSQFMQGFGKKMR